MTFQVGDIPFFKEYQFTDSGESAPHFALVLLPETATKYQNSILCCVITSRLPKKWHLALEKKDYPFLIFRSFVCFDRKDLVSMNGLDDFPQPKGKLNQDDFKKGFKILVKSLFVIKDMANEPFLRGTIIYEWKQALKSKNIGHNSFKK